MDDANPMIPGEISTISMASDGRSWPNNLNLSMIR
jgi:hypothetical protein